MRMHDRQERPSKMTYGPGFYKTACPLCHAAANGFPTVGPCQHYECENCGPFQIDQDADAALRHQAKALSDTGIRSIREELFINERNGKITFLTDIQAYL